MRRLWAWPLILGFVALSALAPDAARAACTVPNTLTNGQTADASQVMANFNSVLGCVNGAPAGSTNALQYNAGSGSFGAVGPLTNGQIAIGSTGAAPQAAQLSAGTGITITNGPGTITISGAATPYTPPKLANFTFGNQPTGDIAADTSFGLALAASSTAGRMALWNTASYPSTPVSFVAGFNATTDSTGGVTGLSIGDGTGKFVELFLNFYSGSWHFQCNYMSSYSTAGNVLFTTVLPDRPKFIAIYDDGTNFNFLYGDARKFLLQTQQVPRNAWIGTPTEFGITSESNGGAGFNATFFDYEIASGSP